MFCNVAHIHVFQRVESIYATQVEFSLFANNYQIFFLHNVFALKRGFHFFDKN